MFEVREDNSNYGDLLYSFTLDGTQLSGSFQVSDALTGSNTLESVMEVFDAPSSRSTPTPTPNPNNYNDMGYTRQELNDLIAKKRQEIKDLQLKVDQAELDLKKAQIALDNSTVRSTIDGVVRTLTDVDTAKASSSPFLVVSGQAQFTVTGTLSEKPAGQREGGGRDLCHELRHRHGIQRHHHPDLRLPLGGELLQRLWQQQQLQL